MPEIKINKVNFFCVGVQKAGTTLLHDILRQHSNIYLPAEKEAHFFDVNEFYDKGIGYYFDTYYKSYLGEKIIGNINPNLQLETRSIDRIIEAFGTDIKIIILLRDPVKRAYSHYLMSKKRGYENLDFIQAVKKEGKRISNPKFYRGYESQELGHFEKNHLGYITRGLYSTLLEYLYKKFDKDNVKVLIFEEFISNKEKTINDILQFLGVEKEHLNVNIRSNPAQEAISYKLSKFLNTHSIAKDFLKCIFPKAMRSPIKAALNSKNLREISKNENSIPYDYAELKRTYFKKDILKVEKILNRKIEKWI